MKKIKVGIPQAFIYYKYNVMLKAFFEKLNCKVIVSPETNQEIVQTGINNSIKEYCLPYKIYLGHILYLSDKCDYILISKIIKYSTEEPTCPIFNSINDKIKLLISKDQILRLDLNYNNNYYELISFLKLGLKITYNIPKIIYSYLQAKKKQNNYNISRRNEQINNLSKTGPKLLLASNYYNIQDNYIVKKIVNILKNNEIIPIFSNKLEYKTANLFSDYFNHSLSTKHTKEMTGSVYYYKNQVEGILLLSIDNCINSIIINKELINQNKSYPILNIIINETLSNKILEETLLPFIKQIKELYKDK